MKKNLFNSLIVILLMLFQGSIYGGGIEPWIVGSLICEEDCGTITVTATAYCTCEEGTVTIDSSGLECTSGNATGSGGGWTASGPGTYTFGGVTASCSCGNNANLTGSITINASEVGGPGDDVIVECEDCEDDCKPSDVIVRNDSDCTMTFKYNNEVFKVTGGTAATGGGEIEIAAHSSITLTLARPYESLTDAEKNEIIELPDGRKIKIRKSGSDPDGFTGGPMMPGAMGSTPLPNGEGCLSCGGGSGTSSREYKYHNMEVNIRSREENTLANKSNVLEVGTTSPYTVEANINLGGDWFSVHNRKGWVCIKYDDTIDDDDVIGFKVTDPDKNEYYYYELGGTLTVNDRPKLRKVVKKTAPTSDEEITYNYDGDDLDYQEDEGGNQIQYNYASGSLSSLDFNNGSTDERTIEFAYNSDGKLTQINCSSCSSAQTSYSYVDSNELKYDSTISANVPTHQYLSGIKDSAGADMAYYEYDRNDRIIEHRLGDFNGDLVTEWEYTENSSGVLTAILRKDYVDDTNYRATVYLYSNGSLTSKTEYQDEQSDASYPDGDGSATSYSYGTATNVKHTITELPSGLQEITETVDDTNVANHGQLNRKLKKYGTTELLLGEYSYDEHENTAQTESKILLDSYKNAFNGTTEYSYDDDNGFDKIKIVGPEISSGVYQNLPGQSDSRKVYDTLGRVVYDFQKDGNSKWVGRQNVYDDNTGLLDTVKDGVVFDVTEGSNDDFTASVYTDTNAVVTQYTYNDFGELDEVATVVGSTKKNIRRNYYSDNGVKIGQSLILATGYAVSASKSTFDSNGRLIIKSVVKASDHFLESTLESDLEITLTVDDTTSPANQVAGASSLSLTWVHTVYVYDTFGRQTAVVEDATEENQTARSHLTTEYYYNYQGEVKIVRHPDGKAVKTVRDGRGLVKEERTGNFTTAGDPDTFTTKIMVEYTYDDNGNLITKTEPHPNVYSDGDSIADKVKTVYIYDEFDRMKGSYTETVLGTS